MLDDWSSTCEYDYTYVNTELMRIYEDTHISATHGNIRFTHSNRHKEYEFCPPFTFRKQRKRSLWCCHIEFLSDEQILNFPVQFRKYESQSSYKQVIFCILQPQLWISCEWSLSTSINLTSAGSLTQLTSTWRPGFCSAAWVRRIKENF